MTKWTFFSIAVICLTVGTIVETLYGPGEEPCSCN